MKSCPSGYMALNIVRVRIFWTSNIFVIIVFPYTHDTGTVTGMELGVEELLCLRRKFSLKLPVN